MYLPKGVRNSFSSHMNYFRFTYDLLKYDGSDQWVITSDRVCNEDIPASQQIPVQKLLNCRSKEKMDSSLVSLR